MRTLITIIAPGRLYRSAGRYFVFMALAGWLATAESARAQEKSLLWQVSRDGNSMYLLGSIHYLRQEHYPLHATILKALDGSKKLILEIDLNTRLGGIRAKDDRGESTSIVTARPWPRMSVRKPTSAPRAGPTSWGSTCAF